MMEARIERKRENAFAAATAFHAPEKLTELYPAPLPPAKIKWWSDGSS